MKCAKQKKPDHRGRGQQPSDKPGRQARRHIAFTASHGNRVGQQPLCLKSAQSSRTSKHKKNNSYGLPSRLPVVFQHATPPPQQPASYSRGERQRLPPLFSAAPLERDDVTYVDDVIEECRRCRNGGDA